MLYPVQLMLLAETVRLISKSNHSLPKPWSPCTCTNNLATL